MEPGGPLPCSRKYATCPYNEPDESDTQSTSLFIFFNYICPTNAQYILTVPASYSTPTCFDVCTPSSGSFALCTLNLQN